MMPHRQWVGASRADLRRVIERAEQQRVGRVLLLEGYRSAGNERAAIETAQVIAQLDTHLYRLRLLALDTSEETR